MLEYITKEIFELAPEKVQKVFKDYFDGDLILVGTYYHAMGYEIYYKEKLDEFPALTEGDLRKFIEDKTGCSLEVRLLYAKCGYDITICGIAENTYTVNQEDNDLLQAYWEVACKIIEEERVI